MKRMDDREGCERLREVGFTASEIEKLRLLRDIYVQQEIRQSTPPSQPKHVSWFERAIRKLVSLCRYQADCEANMWMYDHFLY